MLVQHIVQSLGGPGAPPASGMSHSDYDSFVSLQLDMPSGETVFLLPHFKNALMLLGALKFYDFLGYRVGDGQSKSPGLYSQSMMSLPGRADGGDLGVSVNMGPGSGNRQTPLHMVGAGNSRVSGVIVWSIDW